MNYSELKALFCKHESNNPATHLTAYITFFSFGQENKKEYSWISRTYAVSSNNEAFQPNMEGCSIFGSCLDGTAQCVHLENFMREECGSQNGWVVEDCCIVGCLLTPTCFSSDEKAAPELYYSIETAREQMLHQLAEIGELDLDQLKRDYTAGMCSVGTDDYHADKQSASFYGDETWGWELRPAYIYSLLHIEFGYECR